MENQPIATPVSTQGQEPKKSRLLSELFEFVWETAKVVLLSLVIILPIRYYLIQPFFVKGSSMVPNSRQRIYSVDKGLIVLAGRNAEMLSSSDIPAIRKNISSSALSDFRVKRCWPATIIRSRCSMSATRTDSWSASRAIFRRQIHLLRQQDDLVRSKVTLKSNRVLHDGR